MALQKPPIKLVVHIVATLPAWYVKIHEMKNGTEVHNSTFRRPNFMAKPPNKAPNSAPNKDKLVIHETSRSVTGKPFVLADSWTELKLDEYEVDIRCSDDGMVTVVPGLGVLFWRESMAGELYPLASPAASGPKETASAASICEEHENNCDFENKLWDRSYGRIFAVFEAKSGIAISIRKYFDLFSKTENRSRHLTFF